MYFLRLTKLKPAVEKVAQDAWEDFVIAGEAAKKLERVLDVRQGALCWVIGTVYMEMVFKPNILDDIGKDVGLPFPNSELIKRMKGHLLTLSSIGSPPPHHTINTSPPQAKTS
jgi:hypothetical protein